MCEYDGNTNWDAENEADEDDAEHLVQLFTPATSAIKRGA